MKCAEPSVDELLQTCFLDGDDYTKRLGLDLLRSATKAPKRRDGLVSRLRFRRLIGNWSTDIRKVYVGGL